jgi:hypothetical protein
MYWYGQDEQNGSSTKNYLSIATTNSTIPFLAPQEEPLQ